ncbi:hypothetical protein [Ornithinimicrobium avium]|uniref:Uncharacterized protein n=1 Tax=Ornithinimicrobium avium TaxID=2283195 RepID=A0A345NK97_9MICO|nr:hypothetical protein [Ornithinimicrobium avium]AXH95455.1 hypothetical protein DV701_04315 [Ornithinimicrobium avium]
MSDEPLAEPDPDDEDLTDEEGSQLMLEALAELHELADSGETEVLTDLLDWILSHGQWLPDSVDYDGLLLVLVRNLLLLGQVEEAEDVRSYLDLEVVEHHPVMKAEHVLHELFLQLMKGDETAYQQALREAVEPVSRSDEPQHHEMLRNALAGLAPMASDPRSGLREQASQDLGPDPEPAANERIVAAFAALGRGEASRELEQDLVDLARSLVDGDYLHRAAAALLAAAQVAVHRTDPVGAAAHAAAGRQVICSRGPLSQHPIRRQLDLTYASMLHLLGRTRLADQIFDSVRGSVGTDGLLSGLTHMMYGMSRLEPDPWAALAAGLLAHDCFVGFRATLPSVGERAQTDELLAGAAEVVLRAAEQVRDPAVLSEALEILRMQGLPVRAEGAGASAPLWMLMDALGVPAKRPRWRVEHERQPAVLTGPRPVPRMPWGGTLTGLLPRRADGDGQIVAVRVAR